MATFGTGTSFGTFGQKTDGAFGSQTAVTSAPASTFQFGGMGTSVAPSAFGGFASNPAGTGTSIFGTQPTAGAPASTSFGGFSFGTAAPTVTTASLGGFGSGFNFGSGTTNPLMTGTQTGFGGFGGTSSTLPNTTFGGFGFGGTTAATTTTTSGFGSGFSFGQGFGGTTTTTSGFGSRPILAMAPTSGATAFGAGDQTFPNMMAALFCPVLYGDERDSIIAKWNQLQAYWGCGVGFYAVGCQPITFTPDNVFCKFKAVGYSCLPTSKNEDGLVSLLIDKNDVEVRTLQPQLVDGLFKILGSNSSISVCVEGVKPSANNKSEVTIYILERAPTGVSKRVLANDLYTYLNNQNVKQQLTSFSVEKVIIKAKPSAEQLRNYLDNPQAGIDHLVWQQACKDNPDSERFIPIPMIGFGELNRRLKQQEEETKVHDSRLKMIGSELNDLRNRLNSREAKNAEFKRKHLELCHRILKVMIKQEINRKLGMALQADEEQLKVQVDGISTDLNAPNQAKGRLNELMAQIRLQKENFSSLVHERYNMDPTLQGELKRHLKKQQDGLNLMVNVLKANFDYLKLVEDKLKEDVTKT